MTEKNKEYLLDTNHCAYILNAKIKPKSKQSEMEKNTIKLASSCLDSFIYISEATLGELIYGVECSKRKENNLQELEAFTKLISPLSVDKDVWEIFGKTKAELRKLGKKMPDIDLLIASTAKRYGLILVTNDKHMTLLDYLPEPFVERENWAQVIANE